MKNLVLKWWWLDSQSPELHTLFANSKKLVSSVAESK